MNKKAAMMIVPTGIGARIGGYAGDASPYAKKIADTIPLIVNPNIVNAAGFSGITENMYYVEGWSISQFLKGNISLEPSRNNKIGIIFDKAIPQNILNVHINTFNAVKTVYGINVIGYEISRENAGVEFFTSDSGISTGFLNNPQTLAEAGKKLIERGAQVLAVVCYFEEPQEDGYENGKGVDVVGGIEAIISHHLTKELFVPCVHAPAFSDITICEKIVNPKVSSEYITPTFLPCLLMGLNNAPLIRKAENGNCITYRDLHSIVMPYDSLGSSIVFDAVEKNIQVFAVKENKTVLNVNAQSLNLQNDIIILNSYDEYIKRLNTEKEYE